MALYKYFPAERIDVLQSGRVCFSSPLNLNDPFEFMPPLKLYENDERMAQAIERMLPQIVEQEYALLDPEVRASISKEMLLDFLRHKALPHIQHVVHDMRIELPSMQARLHEKIQQSLGILCLTETFDELLMWAHYSNSHTGFVVEFDTDHVFFNSRKSIHDELRHLRKVEYSEVRPTLVLVSEEGIRPLLVKSCHWAYEKEWRMVVPLEEAAEIKEAGGAKYHLFDFPRECIRTVFLGCRMVADRREELLGLLRSESTLASVQCMQAQADQHYFRLNFSELDLAR